MLKVFWLERMMRFD